MANFAGIAAVGRSIEALLTARFASDEPIPGKKTKAVLARASDFDTTSPESAIGSPSLSILLYRVESNKTMRAAWSGVAAQDGRSRVPLDLHYLLTAWAENAEHEHRILGKALDSLEATPVLGGPLLHPMGGWAPGETVQIVMEDVPPDALLRTFDSLPSGFRLSVPFVARVVRIESRTAEPDAPATTVVSGAKPEVDR